MSSDVVGGRRSRVLRGASAAAVRGAALDADLSILRPAPELAQLSPQNAEDALRESREAAARVGYEDGYQAGRIEAAADAQTSAAASRTAVAQAMEALELAAADLAKRQATAIADVERHIVELGVAVAEAVLDRELTAATAPAREAFIRALRLAPERGDVVARLHPDDLGALDELGSHAADRHVTVVPDAAVEPGGCVIDVGACRIDAQVATALARVREALRP